ncbi:bifunctional diaminohydroxyphosphoribosylaminopyrimidine deaminase/5-amino-6-(5-phosphoribosylamino)uracil reductase RibD [bacterium]|nr:bifunctional diaminohydroxyphosphoribosylaminopyrimidine deaminase/5-amino-6-(5-phosphoribosylamino)uracil reductase RibD [bacterium]NBX83240.1 bifunctional diaminohydroxyphosphoribosylaminopyrimidine deaminase/5-amino-6-(5-phosphoribosylamino)uracil reductase RibD [bacterium]
MTGFIKEALAEARKRKGYTYPNPAVGAVLVANQQVVGRGMHWAAGQPHAEVEALRGVREAAGTTLFVTLEPCCHFGKTPPCTDLIQEKKISRVVYAHADPNPQVSGKGAQILRDAGIEVSYIQDPEVDDFYRSYDFWTRHQRTWLTAKLALTKDFGTSGESGERLFISGPEANAYTHRRRSEADVLITSESTIRIDNPLFTVRLGKQVIKKPICILDREFRCALDSDIIKNALQTIWVGDHNRIETGKQRFLGLKGQVLGLESSKNLLRLEGLSSLLAQQGFHEAWIECGPRVFTELVKNQWVQEVVLYLSKKIAGSGGRLYFESLSIENHYRLLNVQETDSDRIEVWRLKRVFQDE